MSASYFGESHGTSTGDASYSTRYLCPYYIHDSVTYKRCLFHEIEDIPRLSQHLSRTHMNWCDRCKQPFHSEKTLKTHEQAGTCLGQEMYPVGYLNNAIKRDCMDGMATQQMDEEQKLHHIFVSLFGYNPPAGNYCRFYGPPHSEAYGQAKLEVALLHIEMVIEAIGNLNPQYMFLTKLFRRLLEVTSKGPRSPNDDQRLDIARLADEKARGGLRAQPLHSFMLPPSVLPSASDIAQAQSVFDRFFNIARDSDIDSSIHRQPMTDGDGYGHEYDFESTF